MKKILKKILNKLPLVCGCQIDKTLREATDFKMLGITWRRKETSFFRSHIIVTQCNHCKRLYTWSRVLYISEYTKFQAIFNSAKSQEMEIECLRDMLIQSDIRWGVTGIRSKNG